MTLDNPQREQARHYIAILKALHVAGGSNKWVTAPAVTKAGNANGSDLNNTTVYRALSSMRTEVEYRTVNRVRRFHLKHAGQKLLGNVNSPHTPIFISPGTPWSTQRQLQEFLKKNSSSVLFVIDPYISEDTLDVLKDVTAPIRILAAKLGRKGKESSFLRVYKKFHREKKGCVELRQCSHKDLHGRYILTGGRGWVVDHSLQDLGTKPALIIPLHLDIVFPQLHTHFENIFLKSTLIT